MNKGAKIKTDMSSPPRAPPDLHWQSEITWVINDRGDDDDKTDDIIFRISDGSNVFHNYFILFPQPQAAAGYLSGWCSWGVTFARWILIGDLAEPTLSTITLLMPHFVNAVYKRWTWTWKYFFVNIFKPVKDNDLMGWTSPKRHSMFL